MQIVIRRIVRARSVVVLYRAEVARARYGYDSEVVKLFAGMLLPVWEPSYYPGVLCDGSVKCY